MGFFEWFRRRRTPKPGKISHGFVVLDVETTGLAPDRDRVLEIALVRTDASGQIVDEWATLLDPEGPVGATQIHGITAAHVRGAPRFRDVVSEVNARLSGRVLVAHNAPFDLRFLTAEYARAGVTFPDAPVLCTLQASHTYLPDVARRRLADLCWVCRIPLHDAHSALGDARATAHLLAHYLDRAVPEHAALPVAAARVPWPALPIVPVQPVGRPTHTTALVPATPGILWRLLDDLPLSTVVDEGAPDTSQPYLELLFEVLEDGLLTSQEADALVELARVYALTHDQVQATHRAFLLALAHRIVEDGRVTDDERKELTYACDVLGYTDTLPHQIVDEAMAARQAHPAGAPQPFPPQWNHGESPHVGDAVVFTGCDPLERARLEGRSLAAGLRVTGSVSGRTALLVTDGANPGTVKAVAARRHGTRIVTPGVFAAIVEHVQPSLTPAVPEPRPAEDPATVRAWAREHGMELGFRGRIPAAVLSAYRAAP